MKEARTPTDLAEDRASRRPRREARETGRLGREIYKRDIRYKVEPDHIGKFVAIDVDSGRWALGDSISEARDRLDLKCTEAVDVLFERIGYRAVGSFGGGAPRRTEWSGE